MSNNTTPPLISVVIPCHNHRLFLATAINSVTKQTAKLAYEIVLIDDNSQDNPEVVMRQFTDVNFQFRRISAQSPSVARNLGTRLSRGQIIIYLDADNQLLPNFFSETVVPIMNNQAEVVFGQALNFGSIEANQAIFNSYLPSFSSLYLISSIDTCCAVKKVALPKNPWDKDIPYSEEDWDFHLNNLSHKLRYQFIDKPIYRYYVSSAKKNTTQHFAKILACRQYVHKKYESFYTLPASSFLISVSGSGQHLKQRLTAMLAQDSDKNIKSLIFINNAQNTNLIEQCVVPFIKKYQDQYHSIAVTSLAHPQYLSPAQQFEVNWRHGLKIATQKPSKIYLQNSASLQNSTNLIKTSLAINYVLHSITSIKQLHCLLQSLSFDSEKDQLTLIPQNYLTYKQLRDAQFPPNTVLKNCSTNLATELNSQLANLSFDYLVCFGSNCTIDYKFRERLQNMLPDQIIYGYTTDGPKAIDVLNLLVIKPKDLPLSNLFNSKFQDYSALSLSFCLSMMRKNIGIQSSSYLRINRPAKLSYKNKARLIFSLGLIASQEIPIMQYFTFKRKYLPKQVYVNWHPLFWLGVLADFLARPIFRKKRFFLP